MDSVAQQSLAELDADGNDSVARQALDELDKMDGELLQDPPAGAVAGAAQPSAVSAKELVPKTAVAWDADAGDHRWPDATPAGDNRWPDATTAAANGSCLCSKCKLMKPVEGTAVHGIAFCCRHCNTKRSTLSQVFGYWPVSLFSCLPEPQQTAFWQSDARGKVEIQNALV